MNQRTKAPNRPRNPAPEASPPPSRRRTTVWVLSVIALVVVAVGAIAFATTRGGEASMAAPRRRRRRGTGRARLRHGARRPAGGAGPGNRQRDCAGGPARQRGRSGRRAGRAADQRVQHARRQPGHDRQRRQAEADLHRRPLVPALPEGGPADPAMDRRRQGAGRSRAVRGLDRARPERRLATAWLTRSAGRCRPSRTPVTTRTRGTRSQRHPFIVAVDENSKVVARVSGEQPVQKLDTSRPS